MASHIKRSRLAASDGQMPWLIAEAFAFLYQRSFMEIFTLHSLAFEIYFSVRCHYELQYSLQYQDRIPP